MKKLDDIDSQILTILYKNADITNKELSTKIGVAPSTCLERVKRLKINGIIKKITQMNIASKNETFTLKEFLTEYNNIKNELTQQFK